MHLIMIAALTASQGSTNRHYVRQSMVSDRCVLIPAYRPAFEDLARLVSTSQRLSLDMESVRLFAILSDGDEVSDFRQQYPQQSAALTFLALDGLLHRHVRENVTLSGLMLEHNSGCWEPHEELCLPSINLWDWMRFTEGAVRMAGCWTVNRCHYASSRV